MENLVMRKCCCKCGYGVHKCAVLIVLVSMVISGLMLAGAIYDLLTQRDGKDIRNWMLEVVMNYDENDLLTDYRIVTLSGQIIIITITTSVLAFLLGVSALYGILMRKKYYVLPWLIFNGTSLIGLIFIFVIFSIVFPLGILLLMIFVVPFAYIYIVGHSFFFRISAAEDRERESDSFIRT